MKEFCEDLTNTEVYIAHEKLLGNIVKNITEDKLGKYISAIIISGSFGRGEPTYRIENGNIVYESDMEMVLVYTNWVNLFRIKKFSKEIINRFPQFELELIPISASRLTHVRNHNYSLLRPKKITLFTYDFYNGSRTIWGREYLNHTVTIEKIDSFEGKRIIANRVAELVYVRSQHGTIEEQHRWLAKTILALGTAYLIEKKIYKSAYHEQEETLNSCELSLSASGRDFLILYKKAYQYLREGVMENSFFPYENHIKKYIKQAYDYYSARGVHSSHTNCAYIIIREAMLLLKYDHKDWKYIFNPKELILNNMLISYASNSDESEKWAQLWKNVLN